MTIRAKLLVFFIVQHFIFFVIALFLYEFFILPYAYKMDENAAHEKIHQVEQVFLSEIDHLDLTNKDWAFWEDSYDFVQDYNEEYVQSNLVANLLDDIKLSVIAYFNRDNHLVYVMDDKSVPASTYMDEKAYLHKDVENYKTLPRGGIVRVDRYIGIWSIHDIRRNDESNESGGSLLMIRTLHNELLDRINKSANITLQLNSSPQSFKKREANFFVRDVNASTLLVGGYLQGFDDKSRVFFSFPYERYQLKETKKMMISLLFFGGLLGLLSLIISVMLLRINVVSPLKQLGEHIVTLRKQNSFTSSRLSEREDEIGLLAKAFNHLIETIRQNNELIEKVARIDALTGLANRMDLNEQFEKELRVSCRQRSEMSVLMIDIDYFKKYNDTYGHVMGDEVLKQVAGTLLNSSHRPHDYAARYGGEEFMILLPKTGSEGAQLIAQRVIDNIAALKMEHVGTQLEKKIVSVSIGCLTHLAQKGDTVESVINLADKALYEAKAQGRDRFVVYGASSQG